LSNFNQEYYLLGKIPTLKSQLEIKLFNTFRSFINYKNTFPRSLFPHVDNRGAFIELIKTEIGGQFSFSTTFADITRGNHFHTRKIERFMVIKGKALIQLRKYGTEEVLNFELDGDKSSYVDMPVWYIHNIKNIGSEVLYTNFWINEAYDAADPDTYFEAV
jgi:UDP-2-acetamido-2,6-beta-L-arabino-hexul-4-ose reductase